MARGGGKGGGDGYSEGDLGEEKEEELDHSTFVAQASKPATSSYRAAGVAPAKGTATCTAVASMVHRPVLLSGGSTSPATPADAL